MGTETRIEFGSREHLAWLRAQREATEARESHPIGSTVTTTVHGIGGRAEKVTGTVADHRRNAVVVATDCHGRIVVPLAKIEGRP